MLSEYLSMQLMSLTKRVRRTLIFCVCTVACLPVANADSVNGAWSSLEDWPLIAVHAALTPDGRVLTYGTDGAGKQTGYFIYDIWDPAAGLSGGHLTLNNMTLTDVFCSSQIILPQTGEILIAGGDNWTGTGTTNTGNNNSNIFTYDDNTLARSVNMNRARWYSSSTALINGDIYVQGGTSGGDLPEVRQTDGLFRLLNGAPTDSFATVFPRNFLAPDGRVFGYDTNGKMFFVDASGSGSLVTAGQFSSSNAGWTSGAAMFQPGKILQMGGNSNGAIVIDINGPTPVVTPTQSMSTQRHWVSATVLADGKVLGTGGSKVDNKLDGVNTKAEIWNPATGSWHVGPPGAIARLYHSSALLLPDASVLVAGGGAPGPLNNTNAEIYYPPYLYNGLGGFAVRPQILNAPDTVNVGDTLSIQVDTSDISRVTLVKSGSVTHSVNMDQRFLELSFTESGNVLYADLPLRATDTPPGYYLAFVFDSAGVPSVAKMLRINIDPSPNTAVDYTPAIGGGGGSAFRLACDADEILVGVHGNYATYVNQIGPKCVTMDQYGRWIGDPGDRPVTGSTTGGTAFSKTCPRDFAMSGFQGRSDQYVNQVEIACRALNPDGTLTGEAQYMGGTGGPGGNAQGPLSCGTDNPVYALYGQSGGWLDSIGAECRQGPITPISVNSDPVIVNPGAQFDAIGQAVSLEISASDGDGDTLIFSTTDLPAGLSINSATGQITGTPTIDALFNTEVTVSDGVLTDTTSFDWAISPALPLSVDPMPPQAPQEVNTEVTYSAVTSGGLNAIYKWNFGDGTPESAFSSASSIVHSYTDPGIYHVTLTVDDDVEEPNVQTFVQTIHLPLTVNAPGSSSNIAYEDRPIGNSRLWAVNQDNKTVSVFDAVANTRLTEIPVGDSPRSVAIAPDGRVWVSNKGSATISIIDPTALDVVQTVSLPFASQPYGIVFSPAANEAYVVLEATNRLLKLDGSSGAQLDFFDTVPHPRHLAINAAGTFVYVSRFVSARQPGEETDTVHSETNGQKTGGEIQVVDTASMTLISNVILQHSDDDDAENQGSGVPNYIGALAISPDGTSARAPSKKDNIGRGTLRSLANLNFQNTVRAISSRIELSTNTEDYPSRIDYDDASIASAVIFDHTGVYAFVALETSREVAVVDAYSSAELFRIDVGRAPQGLAISAGGDRLFVSNFMDRSVDVFDLTDLQSNGQWNLPKLATLQSVTNEELTAQVLLGKQLFYDARDTRLARDRYLSCATCHNDGAEDGRVWDLTGMGEGLRNTISLRGRTGGQGFLHWSENFDEVQDFEGQIRSLSEGTGLMTDVDFNAGTRSESLGDAKAGISEDLDALAAYVESLDTHAASPHRNSDGSLTADALAGKQVFQDQNCVTCHGGPDYTDSGANILHDIGTLKPSSGTRLDGILSGIDTPTLRGVWSSAPYLHDGSAQTLEESVAAHNGVSLNPSDMSLLVAYLKQIDGLEPVANESPVAIASNVETDEDVAIAITLEGTDPEGAPVSFTVTGAPGNGALSGTAPNLTYTPNADFNGADSFDFDVSDGNGGSDSATVSITVISVNDPPVAIGDLFSLPVNSLLNVAAPGVLENDTDDGAALSTVIVTGAQFGTVTLNSDGSFTYTPTPGYSGADSFTYAVSDGEFTSNTVVVDITVIAEPPAFLQDDGPDGIVSMKVLSSDANVTQGTHAWVSDSIQGVDAMRAMPDINTNNNTGYVSNSPRLDFDVNFIKTGTHYVWIHGYKTGGSDDSIHIGLNGNAVSTSDRISNFASTNQWLWTSTTMDGNSRATINVGTTGVHTINAWMREDGFRFDAIVLTTDSNFTPTGTGPAESLRGGGDTMPPAVPTGLAASSGEGSVELDWNDNAEPDLAGYNVYRSNTTGGPYTLLASDITESAYTDGTVTNPTMYYYVVSAVDTADNESVASTEVSETAAPDTTAPAAPSGLSATAGDSLVSLDWADNNETDHAGYNIHRSETTGGPYTPLASDVTESTYTDNTAINGTSYYYVVTALDASGNQSGISTPVQATPEIGTVKLVTGVVTDVGNLWETVTLPQLYNSMVVVASASYGASDLPAVTRVRNATGNSFEVMVQNPGNIPLSGYTVHYMVVEAGTYTLAADGVKMEAALFNSTVTDGKNSWNGQQTGYSQSYTSPVVLGQVMTANDPAWSSFWASNGTPSNPPSASALYVGKHVGEDTNTTRANETIGYIVIESGAGTANGLAYTAAVGSDTVRGFNNSPPFTYALGGLDSPTVAVVSSTGMDGGDGGFPLLFGPDPVTATSLDLAVDEDQIGDSERAHTTEQLAYIVFDAIPNTPPILAGIGNQEVDEENLLTFVASATDADLPPDLLTYSLAAGAPAGANIDPTSGEFTWTPTETEGPGSHDVTIIVTDNGTVNLSDSETITITVNEINVAPVLTAIGAQSVDEQATLTFAATATDTDLPADTLTFSLAAGAPAGADIDPSSGVFTWTPTEEQVGGGIHNATIIVTDDGTPNLFDSETIAITVNDVNNAPILVPIGDKIVAEGLPLTFTVTASDNDVPADDTSLSVTGLPADATFNTTTGEFSWTPAEAQQVNVTFTVTDNGTPALFDSETITITVNEVSVAPVLTAIGAQSVDEQATLAFTAIATDANSADTLTFTLDPAATALGMSITTGGDFSWTPTEEQGGADYNATITVTDDGTPNLFESETITITVNEVNNAPILAGIGNQAVDEENLLTFVASATDADLPSDVLTYSLAVGAPAAAHIDPTSGVFTWTPTEVHGGADHSVTITVTDNGIPSLFHSETITITVNEVNVAPELAAPTPNPATFASAPSADSGTAISMTATTASDATGPVEYLFTETSGNPGATSSSWQTSTSYTDSGLNSSTQYTYTVTSRDALGNTGTASSGASATTDDDDAPTPNPATFSSAPSADSATAISMTATTAADVTGPVEYLFTETSGNPGATSSAWQTSTSYTDSGLDASTQYTYTVTSRDALGNTGTASSGASATTDDESDPPTPNPATDILVTNHSFEADNVAQGAYIVGAASWTFTAVGGVFDRGGPGAYDFQNWTGTTPDASDAEQMAWIDIGSIYQTTGTNLVAGATYTLTVDIGDRSDRAFRGDAILLGTSSTFGTNYLTPTVVSNTTPTSTYGNASNGWETWESTFTVGSGNVGEALRIEITGTGNAFNVDNVRLVNTTVPSDDTPPTPNPATFASAPSADSDTAISMTATTATDDTAPVEYLFTETTGNPGATSSSWQTSTSYTDSGLSASTLYTYTVTSRDALGNTGSASGGASATTDVEADPPTPNPATFASAPSADSDTAISMTATTASDATGPVEYLFTETSGNPGATSSSWQTSTSYTDSGLSASTLYTYTVTSRDALGNTGTSSSGASATTDDESDPPIPNPATFASAPSADSETAISMTATTASDASGPVEYLFTETSGNPGATSSAWQTSTSYTDSGLTQNTQYTYTVTSRDALGNTGTASSAASATTDADTDAPTPNPATFASAPSADSDTAISMTATTASDATGPVEYLFTETSGNPGATSSAWQTSTSYTDSGLDSSTQYTYTVTSRDALSNTGTASGGASATTSAESDPPTPNPATFASAPSADSQTAISMTATTASDVSGPVEYLFTETSGNPGATSSAWQTSTSYTDSGLNSSTQYTYTVTSRDALGNTGSASSGASATTHAETDPPTPNPATFLVVPAADSDTAISMTATTASDATGPVEYLFTETSGNPGATSSAWQTSTSYTDSGLTASTQYTYTVTSRDALGNTGSASGGASATTNAESNPPTPNPATFASAPSADSGTAISMTATTASDAMGPVEYLFTETSGNPGATSSSWQTSTSYTDSGLNSSTQYTYTVTSRDALGNTGTASSGASATTDDDDAPTPNPATFSSAPSADSATAISMTATTAADVTGPVEYLFTETSGNPGATSSAWQTSTSYTDSGLDASTQYTYTVTSRDALGNTGTASSGASATTNDTQVDLQITGMAVSTNMVFELDALNSGVNVFIDRSYTWTSIPALYQGQQFIRTANGDKNNTAANYLSFDINVPATVYILYDDRASQIPGWLDGSWSSSSDIVNNTDVPRRVYFKSFAPGRVVLGGNLRSPAAGARSNYNVVVIPD